MFRVFFGRGFQLNRKIPETSNIFWRPQSHSCLVITCRSNMLEQKFSALRQHHYFQQFVPFPNSVEAEPKPKLIYVSLTHKERRATDIRDLINVLLMNTLRLIYQALAVPIWSDEKLPMKQKIRQVLLEKCILNNKLLKYIIDMLKILELMLGNWTNEKEIKALSCLLYNCPLMSILTASSLC